jgi:hypothetical protein
MIALRALAMSGSSAWVSAIGPTTLTSNCRRSA